MSNNGNFGGLTLIKKGRAHPVWRARVVVNGQRYTRNFVHRVDAAQWLETLRREYTTNVFDRAREAEQITVAAAIARYQRDQLALGKTPEQLKKLNALLKHGDELLRLPLASVMPDHIRRYRDKRLGMSGGFCPRGKRIETKVRKAVNPKTINKEISALSMVFRHARVEWSLSTLQNPTPDMRLKEPESDVGQRVSPEQMAALRAAAIEYERHEFSTVRIAAYIELAVITTARLSALARMKWTDIAAHGKTFEVPVANSKSKRKYSGILPAGARDILATLPRDSDYVFGGNPASVRTAWNRVRERAGVARRLTDLRHEGISNLFENAHLWGLTTEDIRLVTSHRTLRALQVYVHLQSAAVTDRIDRAMKSELQGFVEDLLVDGDAESMQLAQALVRKKREMDARAGGRRGVTIDMQKDGTLVPRR